MTLEARQNTINNIVDAMSGIHGPLKDEIIRRQLFLWYRVDPRLGIEIAKGLKVEFEDLPA